MREIQSHVYEAYQQMPGEDDVARIFAVLRNLGEPGEVVADRLPGAMVRSGTRRNLPLYVAGGILIALFGIPLGFGGFGVLMVCWRRWRACWSPIMPRQEAFFWSAGLRSIGSDSNRCAGAVGQTGDGRLDPSEWASS